MSDIICVTNRALCREDFLQRIEKLAEAKPRAIILREKDMSREEYRETAERVLEICKINNTVCILHSFADIARELNCKALHMPLSQLMSMSAEERENFSILGASCHSVEDGLMAEKLGCTYITAGHVFDTDCKRGTPGRGVNFLKDLCDQVSIPVYAIGGINSENYRSVRRSGAKGACIMSLAMTCDNVEKCLGEFK